MLKRHVSESDCEMPVSSHYLYGIENTEPRLVADAKFHLIEIQFYLLYTTQLCLAPDHIVPVIPPLTEMNCAVIHRLFSDTSRSVASARSSGEPRRFAARVCSYMASWRAVGDPSGATRYSLDMSVGTGPGASVLTVIPWVLPSCAACGQMVVGWKSRQRRLTSLAQNVVRASVAALVAPYTGGPTRTFEAMVPMLTMRPPGGIRPTPTTACVMYVRPKTLTANSYSSCSC